MEKKKQGLLKKYLKNMSKEDIEDIRASLKPHEEHIFKILLEGSDEVKKQVASKLTKKQIDKIADKIAYKVVDKVANKMAKKRADKILTDMRKPENKYILKESILKAGIEFFNKDKKFIHLVVKKFLNTQLEEKRIRKALKK